MPIFRVKSVKIYTGQKKFTRIYSWRSWQIWGMQTSTLAIVDRSITNNLKTSSEAHILKKKWKYRHYEEEDSVNISLQRDSRFFFAYSFENIYPANTISRVKTLGTNCHLDLKNGRGRWGGRWRGSFQLVRSWSAFISLCNKIHCWNQQHTLELTK